MNYSINRSAAIYDIIDGDIVIIHLVTGNYYNLSDTGAFIWQHIVKNASFEGLMAALSANYKDPGSDVKEDLNLFLAQLIKEGLVEQVSANGSGFSGDDLEKAKAEKEDYIKPTLSAFSDMQDFLLVDPIHEVDENGLPKFNQTSKDDE